MTAALLAKHVASVLVLTSVDGAPPAARDVYASADQTVTLHAALKVRAPRRRCVLYTHAKKPRTRCRVETPPADLTVDWFKVEADRPWYNNVPAGGFAVAKIDYVERRWRSKTWSTTADVEPLTRRGLSRGGTMRFRARVSLPTGESFESIAPKGETAGGPKFRRDARMVTLRAGDDYLGHMAELGGLPYIFGSAIIGKAPHQAERRVGVDCADLMVYGLKRLGHDVKYVSSRTMKPLSRSVASRVTGRRGAVYLDADRTPIEVGDDGVKPGDWIIFEGHVAAFYADRGTSGVLDSADLVIHTAWAEVAIESLADSGYGDHAFDVRRAKVLSR